MSVFSRIGNVLGSVLNLGGKSLNNLTGVSAQQNKSFQQQLQANYLTYQEQKAMMDAQNQFDVNMWNLQNQYNSPVAQLARMREAGVDVNPTSYALGTGNLTSTASSVGSNSGFSGSGFSGSGSPAGNPISMLMGVAQGIQGVRESKQRVANMKEQKVNLNEEGDRLIQAIEAGRLENEIRRHNLDIAQERHTFVNDGGVNSAIKGLGTDIGEGIAKAIQSFR